MFLWIFCKKIIWLYHEDGFAVVFVWVHMILIEPAVLCIIYDRVRQGLVETPVRHVTSLLPLLDSQTCLMPRN